MTTFVNYDGVVARIVRPDIECTNGFIHLIDKVVVKVIITFIENKKIFTSVIWKCFRDGISPLVVQTPCFLQSLPYL